jgi:type II secretory pathway pseudopilin PulG
MGQVKAMQTTREPESQLEAESGFVLIAVLFLVALILIGLAVAAPQVARSIQRDKELELVHRGEQYKRAIKLYYKKFGAYPSSIDQLVNTNQIRFLRKRYTDPMTGKDDWKLVYFGQAHVKPMGLFGQTITTGSMIGAAGGGVGSPIAGAPGNTGGGDGSAFGSSAGGVSGSSSGFGSSSGSSFGSGSGSSFGSNGGSSFGGSSSSGGGSFGGSGMSGSSGSGFGTSGATSNSTGTGTAAGNGTTGAFGSSGSTGSTLGGGPIVGVVIPDAHASMKEYKKQKHYNEWEFVYDPLEDQMLAAGGAGVGQQNLNGANPIGSGLGTGFGSTAGGATLMNGGQNGGGFTGSGNQNPGATPTAPQQ